MKSQYEGKERTISALLIIGFVSMGIGALLTVVAFVFFGTVLAYLGPGLVLIGLAMAIASMVIGLTHNRKMDQGEARAPVEGRVVARYAINEIGEMIFDNYDYDAEGARFYVKVMYLNGRREEFECARPVFDQCGEGMRGLLTIHGRWLSMFNPLADTDETKAAYRNL